MMDSESSSAKQGLEAFRIAGLPPDFYYIPDFISVEEEASILQKVGSNSDLQSVYTSEGEERESNE